MRLSTRLSKLETSAGRQRTQASSAQIDACFERMFADDAARDAVVSFHNYMRRHHAGATAEELARAADPKVGELFGAFLDHARRLGVAHFLPSQPPA